MSEVPDNDSDALDYDSDANEYRVSCDRRTERPSVTVASAVADILEREPPEIEPLHKVVDPDCLDDLFRPTERGTPRDEGRVTFSYNGFEVTVYSHGFVVLRPSDEQRRELFE